MNHLLVVATVLTLSLSYNFNLPLSTVESNSQWTRVKLEVEGGAQPYLFSYTQLPIDWKQIKNYVYLPNTILEAQSRYLCRLIVRDRNFQELRATIVFVTSLGKLFLADKIYPYDYEFPDNFFPSGTNSGESQTIKHPDVNERKVREAAQQNLNETQNQVQEESRSVEESMELVQTPGSGLKDIVMNLIPQGDENQEIRQFVEIAQKQAINQKQGQSQVGQIESIFTAFPSPSQLDNIILRADTLTMSKTIQLLITSDSLTCEQKIAYLTDFLGRINSAIKMKKFTLTQLKIIIETASEEIKRLQGEIQFYQDSIEKLGIGILEEKLIEQLNILEQLYDRFNDNDVKIEPEEENLANTEVKIQQLKGQADETRQEITTKQLDLVNVVNDILRLEEGLEEARRRRTAIEVNLSQLKGNLRTVNLKIQIQENNKGALQFRIEQLKEKSDELRQRYSAQEIVSERIRLELIQALNKENEFFESIDKLKLRINQQSEKVATREQSLLQKMIQNLQRNLPSLQQDIDRLYYPCFEAHDFETTVHQGVVIYSISGESFVNYVQNAYQANLPSVKQVVSLRTSNILEDIWSSTFGATFNQTAVANSEQFHFQSDFNCLSPSTLKQGFGTIVSIDRNVIDVENNGEIYKLKLGTCSRIQSTTPLPEVGKTIYWKANDGDGYHQVYTALCL